ncbi:MAG: DUF2141 domain-containing protein [Myxococcales bacterium]|nr:DUF2141 domain-containing protein [Myxococcales bacterium]
MKRNTLIGSWAFVGLSVARAAASAASSPPPSGRLVAEVEAFDPMRGELGCSLFRSAKGFPGDIRHAVVQRHAVVSRKGQCVFEGLAPGTYALSLIHDVNGNRKFDTNFLCMPKEPWGTSNNVTHKFSAPSFEESAFTISAGETKRIAVVLHAR